MARVSRLSRGPCTADELPAGRFGLPHAANEITSLDGRSSSVAYDVAGNMTEVPKLPLPGFAPGRFLCKYDAWNRLRFVYEDDGATPHQIDAADTLVAEYRYDGLHRRITKLVPNASDPATWDRTDYYYNGQWQVLEERKETFATYTAAKQTVAEAPYAQYIWDLRYIDAPICRFRDANGDAADPGGDGLEETLYYTTDANFNVTALVSPSTGNPVERYLYDAYGRVHVVNGAADADDTGLAAWTLDADNVSDWSNEILYAGYRLDAETHLYHVRNRYHHPTLGRFISRDPEGYVDGMSLYEYVSSGPCGSTDPTGTRRYSWWDPRGWVDRAATNVEMVVEGRLKEAAIFWATGHDMREHIDVARRNAVQARELAHTARSSGDSERAKRWDAFAAGEEYRAERGIAGEVATAYVVGAAYGWRGGSEIVVNTFTFGGADALGVTNSWAYQGVGFDWSRTMAVASRETLIAAGTAGLGNALAGTRAGGATIRFLAAARQGQRGVTAMFAVRGGMATLGAYGIYSGATGIAEGWEKIDEGDLRGYVDVVRGAVSIYGGVRGIQSAVGGFRGAWQRATAPNNGVRWNKGWRTADGKFASPQGPGRAGATAESGAWDAVEAKPGWSVRRGRVAVRAASGQVRVYDGAAISPRGRVIGLEVKSGTSPYRGSQLAFDSALNSSGGETLQGLGRNSDLWIRRAMEIRR